MSESTESSTLTLQQLLAHTLDELGIAAQEQGPRLLLEDGLQLVPHMVNSEARSDGRCSTATVIEVYHPQIPDMLFEYQHSAGASEITALHSGFNQWARMDLVTLRDAVQPELERPSMGISYTDEATGQPYQRQVVLGPTGHYQQRPPKASAQAVDQEEDEDGDHDFCPCCLFSNSMEAFSEQLKSREFLGVRLYAARDSQGEISADCRINGEDFPAALPYLQAYVQTWPDAGLEFRKQYVVIRNQPASDQP